MSDLWNTIIINPMINTLLWIYSVLSSLNLIGLIGAFGIAIILFTILVRLLTHPLTVQQLRGAQKMQELQGSKEYQALQKKYKDDKQKLQQEQMKLYQEMGVNPLGSCLPTIIQFPIIIGLYQAIIRALAVTPMQMVDLYNHVYPFIDVSRLLPINNQFLWMNLSLPESATTPLVMFGFAIPILAVVVVITTFLQSRLMTPPSTGGEQGAQMTQAMNLYMPLLMGWLAFSFAAGLALYFITSNLVTIGQYAAMGRINWRNVIPANILAAFKR